MSNTLNIIIGLIIVIGSLLYIFAFNYYEEKVIENNFKGRITYKTISVQIEKPYLLYSYIGLLVGSIVCVWNLFVVLSDYIKSESSSAPSER